jgi:hypothetical protein
MTGGSSSWELDELESMKVVCLFLFLRDGCPPVPTYIPFVVNRPRFGGKVFRLYKGQMKGFSWAGTS